jgi:hypothetical protein
MIWHMFEAYLWYMIYGYYGTYIGIWFEAYVGDIKNMFLVILAYDLCEWIWFC